MVTDAFLLRRQWHRPALLKMQLPYVYQASARSGIQAFSIPTLLSCIHHSGHLIFWHFSIVVKISFAFCIFAFKHLGQWPYPSGGAETWTLLESYSRPIFKISAPPLSALWAQSFVPLGPPYSYTDLRGQIHHGLLKLEAIQRWSAICHM